MYQVSKAFLDAIYQRGAVVRPLVRFTETPVIFTGEDLRAGTPEVTEYVNPDEDLTIGAAPAAELKLSVVNREGLLDGFSYGECRVLLGVRTGSTVWERGTAGLCTAILGYGTAKAVRFDGCAAAPYLLAEGKAAAAQPPSAVQALVIEENTVYCVLESGDVWTAVWTGSALEALDAYTWSDMERFTWAQTAARRWAEYAPATDLSDFMRQKLRRWRGRGFWYADDVCWEFGDAAIDQYEYVPLGVFDPDTPSRRRTQVVSVTANDRMARFDADAADWWNGLGWPMTVQELLGKLCLRLGVPLATTGTFLNSGRVIPSAPLQASSLTYRDVLKWIAEIAGSYARMTRNGALELAWFQTADVNLTAGQYFPDTEKAEYTVPRITGVQVLNAENDVGVLAGSKGNVYQIMDNPLLYGRESEVRALAENIRQRLAAFPAYAPMTVRALGNWAVQAGDILQVDGAALPVFSVTIRYGGGVKCTYQGTGGTARSQPSTERRETFRQAHAVHQLAVTVQGIEDHVADTDGNVADLALFARGLTIKVTNNRDNTAASLDLRSGKIALASQQISFRGLVSFESLKTPGATIIDGANITTGYISADRIRGGTIDADEINVTNLTADSIVSGQFSGAFIADGAISTEKCDATLRRLFADVVDANRILSGSAVASSLLVRQATIAQLRIGDPGSSAPVRIVAASEAHYVLGY